MPITNVELNQLEALAGQRHITQSVAFQLAIDTPDLLDAVRAQRTALITWQFKAAGAALENQRLKAILQGILDNDGSGNSYNAFEVYKFRQLARKALEVCHG